MRKKGFTLIELIITVLVVSIAVYTLLIIIFTATTNTVQLDTMTTGLHLAKGRLEEVSSQAYSNITAESLSAFGGDFADFNSEVAVFFVSGEALDVPVVVDSGYKKITVKVSSSNLASTIEVSTLITDAANE